VCKDKPFFGYSCARGLNCERQNQYYWQCVRPNKNNIDDGTYPIGSAVKSTQDLLSTAAAAAAAAVTAPTVKVLKELQQCGGKGAACEDFGGCVDKAWDGYVCDQGLTCARQNEWYRQVGAVQASLWLFQKDSKHQLATKRLCYMCERLKACLANRYGLQCHCMRSLRFAECMCYRCRRRSQTDSVAPAYAI
jgi:hypothetical protein